MSPFSRALQRVAPPESRLRAPELNSLEITMAMCSFSSFADAATFAKRMAREHKAAVRLMRRADEFIVEGTFPSDSADHIEPEQLPIIAETSPANLATRPSSESVESVTNARLCIECGVVIPQARVVAVPAVSRCAKCQAAFERTHDTRPHISEGFAGTRDENKKMRGQLWGDMRNRGRGR